MFFFRSFPWSHFVRLFRIKIVFNVNALGCCLSVCTCSFHFNTTNKALSLWTFHPNIPVDLSWGVSWSAGGLTAAIGSVGGIFSITVKRCFGVILIKKVLHLMQSQWVFTCRWEIFEPSHHLLQILAVSLFPRGKGGFPPNRPLPCFPSRFTPKNSASVTKTTFWKKHCMQTTFHKGHFECRECRSQRNHWVEVFCRCSQLEKEKHYTAHSVLFEGGGTIEGYVRSNLWLTFWLISVLLWGDGCILRSWLGFRVMSKRF